MPMQKCLPISLFVFLITSLICNSQPIFSDVTLESGINHTFRVYEATFGGGVAVFDYDSDGYEDLFIVGGVGVDALYRNYRDGTFSDKTQEAGLAINDTFVTQGALTADINHDGYTDLYVTTIAISSEGKIDARDTDILYLNSVDGTFSVVTHQYRIDGQLKSSTGAFFGYIDTDGFPDLYVGNYFDKFEGDLLPINHGTIEGIQRPSEDQFCLNNFGNDFSNIALETVPTPPIVIRNEDGEEEIAKGMNPDRSLFSGVFSSFTDTTDRFRKEAQEFTFSPGLEYWYKKMLAIRIGYLYEHVNKGNRKFVTLGTGNVYKRFGFDLSCSIPASLNLLIKDTLSFYLMCGLK